MHGSTAGTDAGASRDTLYIAAFGALWGLLEITAGTALKSLRIPFTGFAMAALAVIVFTAGRRFAPRPGSVVIMAAVAALLKVFSIGGFVLGPFWAILMEGLIGEAALTAFRLRRASCALAGVLVVAYTTIHPLIAQRILYGAEIIPIYVEMLDKGARLLQVDGAAVPAVIGAWLVFVLALGSAAGLAGFHLGQAVQVRVETLRVQGRVA